MQQFRAGDSRNRVDHVPQADFGTTSSESALDVASGYLVTRRAIRIGPLGIPRLLDEYIGDYALVETTKRILVEIRVREPFVGGNRLQASRPDETRSDCFSGSGFLREIQDSPRTVGRIVCLVFARVASFLEVLPSHLQSARLHTRGVCRISSASSYSPRKASMGSVLVARLAGSAEAASASSSIAMAESASTPGSNGLTSNRKERSKRDAATAPSKPKLQPTAASLAPELRMTRITPERWQPSAMRTAISCSRNATENAITP